MSIPATDSIFDVANWFLQKANDEGWFLEYEKLNHMLFLSQIHYAKNNQLGYLFPSIFVCNKNGFVDANFDVVLDYFKANRKSIKLPNNISSFLDGVWKKYSHLSIKDLNKVIKASPAYVDNYIPGTINIVALKDIVEKFQNNSNSTSGQNSLDNKKVLISQNGPVVVSKWQPRKITSISKGE